MKEARMFSGLYSRLWLLEGAYEQCRLLVAIILVSFAHSFIPNRSLEIFCEQNVRHQPLL